MFFFIKINTQPSLDFNMLSMESWALFSGGKLCVRWKSRSWFFGTKFPQALHGILSTFFWLKTLGAVKKSQLTFWNKIFPGSPWNLGHSLLPKNFACGEKTTVDFLDQNFHRLFMESWALSFGWKLCVWRKSRSWFFGTKFPQAFHGILSTLFWWKTLRVAKKPQLIFWNKISTGSVWKLNP